MKQFTFFVTRDITESAEVTVKAETIEEAHEKALEQATDGELDNWQTDDSAGDPYIPDPITFEEKEMAHCNQCGRLQILHTVKVADDTGLSTMNACETCDEYSQGLLGESVYRAMVSDE